jgi:hypothetical protein
MPQISSGYSLGLGINVGVLSRRFASEPQKDGTSRVDLPRGTATASIHPAVVSHRH